MLAVSKSPSLKQTLGSWCFEHCRIGWWGPLIAATLEMPVCPPIVPVEQGFLSLIDYTLQSHMFSWSLYSWASCQAERRSLGIHCFVPFMSDFLSTKAGLVPAACLFIFPSRLACRCTRLPKTSTEGKGWTVFLWLCLFGSFWKFYLKIWTLISRQYGHGCCLLNESSYYI